MKIALNGQNILIKNPAGPERFTLNLYKNLALVDSNNHYVLYLNSEPTSEFINDLFAGNKNFSYKVIPQRNFWTQWQLATDLITNKYDIFFSPRHTFPLLAKPFTKFVIMFHGLEYKTNDEFDVWSIQQWWHPIFVRIVAILADVIVVPSVRTKDAIVNEHWFSNENKIHVVNEGVDGAFHQRSKDEIEKNLDKFDLQFRKYFLFVSTIQPRKNLPILIQAFANLIQANPVYKDLKLVIVGKLGWKYTETLNSPEKYDIVENVKFLNWIDQNDLYPLFSGTLGYANFSKDEGFGLTVLEAMASEIPVAVSDIPAHKEVGLDTIEYANPTDVQAIETKLKLIADDKYPVHNLKIAAARAKEFQWQNTAKNLIDIFINLKPH
jgi:glycosyltransferase involved in cell wall biosynthesis